MKYNIIILIQSYSNSDHIFVWIILPPLVYARIQSTFALVRVVRGDSSRDTSCPILPIIVCMALLHAVKEKSSMVGASQWRIYYHRMWGQLLTICSNVLKQPNGELLVAVNHNQLRTMASETVDPIDWPHPPPSWAVPPKRLVHSINQCNLSGTLTCKRSMRGNQPPCLCGHSGYEWATHMSLDRWERGFPGSGNILLLCGWVWFLELTASLRGDP